MSKIEATYFTMDYLNDVARAATRDSLTNSPWTPLVAVVFSAMMIEAAVNELLFVVNEAASPLPPKVRELQVLARVMRLSDRNVSLATKVQTIATVLSGQPMSEDRQPYQDFDLLMAARNHLVHHRPEQSSREADDAEWQVSNLVRRLVGRGFRQSNSAVEAPAAIELLLQSAVAQWSYDTAEAVVKDLVARLPEDYRVLRHLSPAFHWINAAQ